MSNSVDDKATFRCPLCNVVFQAADKFAGKNAKCPSCAKPILLVKDTANKTKPSPMVIPKAPKPSPQPPKVPVPHPVDDFLFDSEEPLPVLEPLEELPPVAENMSFPAMPTAKVAATPAGPYASPRAETIEYDHNQVQRVTIEDVRIPFGSMVWLIVKFWVASFVILLILWVISWLLLIAFIAVVAALGASASFPRP